MSRPHRPPPSSPPLPRSSRYRFPLAESGSISIIVTFLVLVLGGLALGLLDEGRAARGSLLRHEDTTQALELAETAMVRAEMELRAQVDSGTDGVGATSGALASGTYSANATRDDVYTNRWVVRASGRKGIGLRRIEAGVRRMSGGMFVDGLFSKDGLTFDGSNNTDAYDSRLGTYASQATNMDAGGKYAQKGGNIGSNGGILLDGSSITIRGDAVPGPGETVEMSGSPTVTGDTYPRLEPSDVPPPPLAEFEAALAVNDNGNWTKSKGQVTYNPAAYSLKVGANATLIIPGGTYFLTSLTLDGNSKIEIRGPTRLYSTGTLDMSGGVIANMTGQPKDFLIFNHPYALPEGHVPTEVGIKFTGGAQASLAIYAPETPVTIAGNGDVFGAVVGSDVKVAGNSYFHYDKGLGDMTGGRTTVFERLYWRDLAPPRR